MVLDSTLAYAEVRGDIFGTMARKNQVHDLALSGGQTRDAVSCGLPPGD